LRTLVTVALAGGVTGRPGVTGVAFAQDAADAQADALAAHLANAPLFLQALDFLGTLSFADAMGGIALQDDSFVQRVVLKLDERLRLTPRDPLEPDHADAHKFPLANLVLAAGLNVVRATGFGEEVRRHTIHELETTAIAVALLMGLTSVARGIVSSEMTAMQMAETDDRSIRTDPEELIANSIVQLTLLAAATQVPLSSFGNASVGNEEFREVRLAFTALYDRFLPEARENLSREALLGHIRETLSRSGNPVVNRRVEALLANDALQSHADFTAALEDAAMDHTHDLMTILMATACDDTQAAAGDPGPLVGLYQTYGVDFLQAIPSLVPYTILIGIERAKFAAHRAGIQRPLFTRERRKYMKDFLKETWKNLIVYFATVAPEVSAKVAGTRRTRGTSSKAADGVGVNFSLLEQVLSDIEAIITAVMDPLFSDTMLDTRKTREAVADLQDAVRKFHETLGRETVQRLFAPRADGPAQEVSVARAEVFEHQDRIVGEKASGKAPYPYKRDDPVRNLKDLQIRLASIVDEAGIDNFVAELRDIRRNVGPQLEREIKQELELHRETPTLMAAIKVLRKNPRLRELLDVDYWHARIGPALTDTMFVVFLQGLHLPFLLATSERMMYGAEWFARTPLPAREVLSVLYNNVIGMFADNWADCLAHARWLTNMYLDELAAQVGKLAADYPEVAAAMQAGHFTDDPTRLIPERFTTRIEQTTVLLGTLQRRYPADAARLETALQRHLETAKKYYFKSMLMAMTISVVGSGKSLPGDSTHFTFAAGEKDFTLAVTLRDFQRHPLYHVWELIFSGSYAMFAGPLIAEHVVAPGFSRLRLGSGFLTKVQSLMQEQFREAYPGLDDQFERLRTQLRAPVGVGTGVR
jgi:hypothetical protein